MSNIDLELKAIVRNLTKLHREDGVDFVLATSQDGPNPVLRVSHLKFVDDTQRRQIISVIEKHSINPDDNIARICPASRNTTHITFNKGAWADTDIWYYYQGMFHALGQYMCKAVAKEWIKVAEPRKQATFPYKNNNQSKPPWWPKSVNHIEPDHLDKLGRTGLLVAMLRNPRFDLLAMRERTKLLADTNAKRALLNELYYVATYDRLFFHGDFEPLVDLLKYVSREDQEYLEESLLNVPVSNKPDFVTKMRDESINHEVFELSHSTMSHATKRPARRTSRRLMTPPDSFTHLMDMELDLDASEVSWSSMSE